MKKSNSKKVIKNLVNRYIWWQLPDKDFALSKNRIIAQVMNIGTFEDICLLLENFDKSYLVEVLNQAETGWFNKKSWHYWHNKLQIPLMPYPEKRKLF